jgi:hypothetical protein
MCVTMIGTAVADAPGTARFAAEPGGFGAALSTAGSADVATVAIDRLVGTDALPVPNYLKVGRRGRGISGPLRGAPGPQNGPPHGLSGHTHPGGRGRG